MHGRTARHAFLLMLAVTATAALPARTDETGAPADPPSRAHPRQEGLRALAEIALRELHVVDVAALAAEDARLSTRIGDYVPRVGFPMKAGFSPATSGTWERLAGGDSLWRLRVRTRDALWTVAGFTTFRLQPGAALYVYGVSGERVYGPFTSADVRPHGQLWIPPVPGDTLVIELYWPAPLAKQTPNLLLGTVSHGYREWGGVGAEEGGAILGGGTGTVEPESGSCNNDVNCPLGAGWQDQKRAVVNLLTGSGSGYCSGSLITNTAGDCKNYVLTAAHCLSTQSSATSTMFQFNFERPGCGAGVAPTDQIVSGSQLRATYSGSDVTLLELNTEPDEAFNVFYNGWSRSTTPGTESWCIHHPSNDEKAISFNADPLVDGVNYGPDHWRVTEWEDGTTEPGSSGSPLFDQDHRIVGQLHGGTASCSSITWDEFGKLDVSWAGGGTPSTRLSDWLDPGGTGAMTADGIDASVCRVPQPRLKYETHLLDDGAGNGDGILDPGEAFVLEIDVANTGTLDSSQVSGLLGSATAGVTFTDGAAAWPDIPLGGAIRRSSPPHFAVQLDAAHACGAPVEFQLDLSAAESPGTWMSTFSIPTGVEQVTQLFSDDMESGSGGWTPQTLTGSNAWGQSTTESASPTTSWFVADISTVSDSVLAAPPISGLPADSRLRFSHRINSEGTYDGGVLEYSADGGPWLDAGSLITSGGYTSTISTGYNSPIAGRQAWSGDNGGFTTVVADLSSLAGSDLNLRWRFASDSSVSDVGWYVDDVAIETSAFVCNPPAILPPGEASDPTLPVAPFTIADDPGGYMLSWSAPMSGGTPTDYFLYRTDMSGAYGPQCEVALGSGTSAVVASLPANHGLLVVARNAAGEGSYGHASSGAARNAAGSPCP